MILKDEADEITSELKDAEAAHRKTFSSSGTTKDIELEESHGHQQRNRPGSKPNRDKESEQTPTGAPMR